MAKFDKMYLDLCERILTEGQKEKGRNGYTYRVPDNHWEFNLDEAEGGEFPILNCKKVAWKTATLEMMWIYVVGSIDVAWLNERGIKIWNKFIIGEDGYYTNPDTGERVFFGKEFAGTIGTSYGYIIQHGCEIEGMSQTDWAIKMLKEQPTNRRIIISMWQPPFFRSAVLPPCVYKVQYTIINGKLYSFVEQRSCDTFVGVPFNITQYAMQHCMIAQVVGVRPGKMFYHMCDVHIYEEHIEQVKELLSRKIEAVKMPAPTLWLNPEVTNIHDFDDSKELKDIKLIGYEHLGELRGIVKA